MSDARPVLVAGASGQLGGAITRKLLAAGVPVRALARSAEKLAPLAAAGAEVAAVDLMNLAKATEACRGVSQIIATANNNMGTGAASPMRRDLTIYQNLCAAVRNTGVDRLIYVSFRGATHDAFVDIFKLKWYIEDAIKRSGVTHVLLRPSALTDVWVNEVILPPLRKNGVVMIFGDGTNVANYITVDDAAEFAVRIAARPEVRNEAIEIGGPSNLSFAELVGLVEKHLGTSGKHRHIPVVAMKLLPPVVRLMNETPARLMTLGRFAATVPMAFPGWRATADRFGVSPRTVEDFIASLPR